MSPSSRYVQCAGREIHYTEWGVPDAPVVLAWHGLARTGRDMDDLGDHLADRYRVICPDTLGRGLSQWSPLPQVEYTLAFYAQLAAELFHCLRIEHAHWVGTSMGGAIGTVCAAGLLRPDLKGRIRSLVLNDNAPRLSASALDRIRSYAGEPPTFPTMGELERYFRDIYRPFGTLTEAQWRRLAQTSARRLPDGRVTPHYDPSIIRQFIDHPHDYDLWDHYDALDLPVLCLRGAESDLVLADATDEMLRRGPGARGQLRVVEVPGCGHAPALNVPEQLQLVSDFIDQHEPRKAAPAAARQARSARAPAAFSGQPL